MMFGIVSGAKAAIIGGAAVGLLAGGFAGGYKWQQGPLEKARGDLAIAARLAAGERAARETLDRMCRANDAAASDAATRSEAVRGAVERARREADDAAAAGDDGLDALLRRLREDGRAP